MIKLAPGDLAALPARGEDPSLESIALRRKLAAALMAKAADSSPVGHWTQALARGLQGWGGYFQDQQADKQDKGLRKDANAALMQMFAPSVTGGASPAAYPPQPAVSQAKEAMLPEQPMTPDQQGVASFAQGMGTPNMAASIPKVAGALDPDLVNSVKGSEGYNPKPYWDYKQWTNGYGTRAQGPNDVIDKGGAEKRLAEELSKAQAIVDQHAPDAPPGVKKALTSLTFNAGDKWTRSGLGAAVKAGDYDTAQQKFMQYVKADGQTLPGLVQRRQKEAQWFSQQGQPQQAQQPAQVADASGQMVDRATLERMLQNPYSRDAAVKILQKQIMPDKADTPSNVREYEYFKALPKDQQEQYLRMRRAEKYLDQGPQYINPQTGRTFAKDPAEVERQKEIGTAQGKQAASAPGDISAAEQALTVLDQIKTDEYLDRGTGLSSFGNMIRGTGGYDFEALVSQAKSGAFLTAIQQLRGMGALSNAEGQTATEAVTRMKTGLSKEAFLKAVSDYEAVIRKGMAQAQSRLSGAAPKMPPSSPGAGGGWSIQKVQ